MVFWSVFSFPVMRQFVEIHYDLFLNIILYMVGRWRYIACSC